MPPLPPTPTEDTFFTNLLLLGFRPDVIARRSNVSVTREAFRQVNPRAMEVVLHFLLSTIDSRRGDETFRHCYPCLDPKQGRDFLSASLSWIRDLVAEGDLPVGAAQLSKLKGGGERTITLLWQLSACALRFAMKRKSRTVPVAPIGDAQFHDSLIRSTEVQIERQVKKFVSSVRVGAQAQQKWVRMATDLAEKERIAAKELSRITKSHQPSTIDPDRLKQSSSVVRRVWNAIETHGAESSQAVIDNVLDKTVHQHRLHGPSLIPTVSDTQIAQWEKQVGTSLSLMDSHGRLNVAALVRMWNAAVSDIDKSLSGSFPVNREEASLVKQLSETHVTHLAGLHNLVESLEQLIPLLRHSVAQLASRVEVKASDGFAPQTPAARVAWEKGGQTPSITPWAATLGQSITPQGTAIVARQVRQRVKTESPMNKRKVVAAKKKPAKPVETKAKRNVGWSDGVPTVRHVNPVAAVEDQLVSAIDGTDDTVLQAEEDPLLALGEDAFITRSKLANTPIKPLPPIQPSDDRPATPPNSQPPLDVSPTPGRSFAQKNHQHTPPPPPRRLDFDEVEDEDEEDVDERVSRLRARLADIMASNEPANEWSGGVWDDEIVIGGRLQPKPAYSPPDAPWRRDTLLQDESLADELAQFRGK